MERESTNLWRTLTLLLIPAVAILAIVIVRGRSTAPVLPAGDSSAVPSNLRDAVVAAGATVRVIKSDDPVDLPVMFDVPRFTGTDQAGLTVSTDTLAGQIWVANFIFTRCTSACPLITSRMVLLQQELPGVDVRFVSFSVDQPFDTPAVLSDYAATWAAGESRWQLVSTGSADAVTALTKGLYVPIEHSNDPANPIYHSELFLLIDGAGKVRSIYNSKVEEAMKRLPTDVRKLARGTLPATQPVLATGGAQLFESLGCAGCHNNTKLAPSLVGIWDAQTELADGTKVRVDDGYLRESILNPSAKMAKGFLALMPPYHGHVSEPQLEALLSHVKSLAKQKGGGPREVAGIHHDPVCQMEVRGSKDAIQATVDGKTYYFCCPNCRDEFLAKPKSFLQATTTRPAGH